MDGRIFPARMWAPNVCEYAQAMRLHELGMQYIIGKELRECTLHIRFMWCCIMNLHVL